MPKRGVAALSLTTIALALLLSFRTPDATPPRVGLAGTVAVGNPSPAAANAGTGIAGTGSGSGAGSGTGTGSGSGSGSQPVGGSTAGGSTAQAGQASGGSAPGAGAATAPKPAGYKDGTFTGQAVDMRFGPVQVQVTISGGKIADVTALQLPFDRSRSAQISSYAEPTLRSEVLQAQSANIDMLSGATYTSYAYAESVQSALDQAAKG